MAQRRQPWDGPPRHGRDREEIAITEDYEVDQLIASYIRRRRIRGGKIKTMLRELIARYTKTEMSRERWAIEGWLDQQLKQASPQARHLPRGGR